MALAVPSGVIQLLMSQRAITRSRGRIVHNANAHVHKLPIELLAEIFWTAHGESFKDGSECRLLSTISAVCGQWRSVSLGTPKLWSFFIISTFPTGPKFELHLQRAKAFILRSKDISLQICIVLDDGNAQIAPKQKIHRVFDVVQPHFNRCDELNFNLSTMRPYLDCFPLPSTLERLERLHICGSSLCDMRDEPTPIFSEEYTPPQLNSIIIIGMITTFSENQSSVPLTRIHLSSSPQTWDNNLKLVSRCPSLKSLALIMWDFGEDDNSSSIHVTLPTLTSLSITDDFTFSFASYIYAPLLEELAIVLGETPWNQDNLPKDLSFPYPNLQSLIFVSVEHEELSLITLARVFKALPGLKHLEFNNCAVNDGIVAFLARTSDDVPSEALLESATGETSESVATRLTSAPSHVANHARQAGLASSTPRTMEHLPALESLTIKRTYSFGRLVPKKVIKKLLKSRPGLRFQYDRPVDSGDDGQPRSRLRILAENYGSRFEPEESESEDESGSESENGIALNVGGV